MFVYNHVYGWYNLRLPGGGSAVLELAGGRSAGLWQFGAKWGRTGARAEPSRLFSHCIICITAADENPAQSIGIEGVAPDSCCREKMRREYAGSLRGVALGGARPSRPRVIHESPQSASAKHLRSRDEGAFRPRRPDAPYTGVFMELERNSECGALKLLKRANLARSEAAAEGIGRQGLAAKFSAARRGKNMVGAKLREDNFVPLALPSLAPRTPPEWARLQPRAAAFTMRSRGDILAARKHFQF